MTFKSSGLSNMSPAGPAECNPSVVSVLSESTPSRGFLGAWRLGPACPLPGAGVLLSALCVVQGWLVRGSLSGLPGGSRHISAMPRAASAVCRAVRAGGPQSVVNCESQTWCPQSGSGSVGCMGQYTDFH